MCLEPAEKEDEVANFLMVNFFEKMLCRGMNKEEPPISYRVMGLEVRSVHPYVTEHPDSDSGKREFKSLMKFRVHSTLSNSGLKVVISESDGFSEGYHQGVIHQYKLKDTHQRVASV
ncbi:hypothetical protein Tco_1298471, partial [Tanacetum coccineum]